MWVYRQDLGGNSLGVIASKDNGAGLSEWRFYNQDNGGGGSDLVFDAGRWNVTGGLFRWGGVAVNAWHHHLVAYSFSSTANLPTLYLDGVAQGAPTVDSAPAGTLSSTAYDLILGNNLNNANRNWGGSLRDCAIWNRVLDAAEITRLGKGFESRFVMNGLQFCAPLYGTQNPEPNRRQATGGTLTAAVATSFVNPRLFLPALPASPRFVVASNALQRTLPPAITGGHTPVGERRLRRQLVVPLP